MLNCENRVGLCVKAILSCDYWMLANGENSLTSIPNKSATLLISCGPRNLLKDSCVGEFSFGLGHVTERTLNSD